PLLGVFIYFSMKSNKNSIKNNMFSLISRILIFILLIVSLSDITISLKGKNISTIFLLDVSDSAMSFREEGIKFINNSLKNMPNRNKSGVIVFGANAEVDKFIIDNKEYNEILSVPIINSTNIQEGIQSAITLFPKESSKRIVLITDGEENEGDMLKTTPLLKENNIDLKVYKIENGKSDEVYVDSVKVPENINMGEEFSIVTNIESNVSTSATLTLFSGREKKGEQIVEIEKGKNTFVFKDIQNTGGFKGYKVLINPKIDTEKGNNEYTCYTNVRSKPQILVIEGQNGESTGLVNILNTLNSSYKIIDPVSAPKTLNDFLEYKSIVLNNVHIDDLNNGFLENIETYVKDYSGGLIVTGGEEAYALGGYKGTILEKILPVNMDKKGKNEIPQISINLVIDKSGSMSSDGTGVSKLTLAKESAVKALDNLRNTDEIGVIAFDHSFSFAVPQEPMSDKERIKELISSISLGGGTSIYPALEAAYEAQLESKSKIKHIILLTDGQDEFGMEEYEEILEGMKNNNITLSTVSVGTDANGTLLEYLAKEGKGRNYHTDIYTDIPRIFAKEVLLSTGVYLMNEEFTPKISTSHEILSGVIEEDKFPSLLGYVGTSMKDKAIEVLSSNEDEPILAAWQYGLGRTVAWTSDMSGQWSGNFLAWKNSIQLFKNIIDWSVPSYEENGKLNITQQGNYANIKFESENVTENSKITGIYTSENGDSGEISLEQSEPGVFSGKVQLKDLGFYNFNIREKHGEEMRGNYNGAFALQYSPEYKFNSNSEKLESLVEENNGNFIKFPEEVFTDNIKKSYRKINLTIATLIIALILFFFDIVYRRLNLNINKYLLNFNSKKQVIKDSYDNKKDIFKKEKIKYNSHIKTAEENNLNKLKENECIEKDNSNKKLIFKNKKIAKNDTSKKEQNLLDTSTLLNKKKDRNKE
ncbi:VWA domain-containing protein, partial [Clostridium tarantellae]|uniref:VWA domain-containing protein n=1 Tax=Clostridium tarantellae TaxID=39493 RepID=UPI001F292A00